MNKLLGKCKENTPMNETRKPRRININKEIEINSKKI